MYSAMNSAVIGVQISEQATVERWPVPPGPEVRTPAHTKHLGWYLEFESRVTHRQPQGRASWPRTAWARSGSSGRRSGRPPAPASLQSQRSSTPAPSGARGASMQHLAPRRNPEGWKGHFSLGIRILILHFPENTARVATRLAHSHIPNGRPSCSCQTKNQEFARSDRSAPAWRGSDRRR